MKKHIHPLVKILTLVGLWGGILVGLFYLSPYILDKRDGFFGPIPLANFDGVHYLLIALQGKFLYSEAFFPLYPLLIRLFSFGVRAYMPIVGAVISITSTVLGIWVLYMLVSQKYPATGNWTVLFFILFPTSFYFLSVYTEGLFFLLSVSCFYFLFKRNWFLAALCGCFASATRVIGVCLVLPFVIEYFSTFKQWKPKKSFLYVLLIPVGILAYMGYLWMTSGDPLRFMHVLPGYGSHRSGGSIILLPQVLYRYGKILIFAFLQPTLMSYLTTILEFVSVLCAGYTLYYGWIRRISPSLWWYSAVVLLVPTLSGTFSSMPRYILAAFPIFITLGMIRSTRTKILLAVLFCLTQCLCWIMFVRGWFVA